MDIAGLEVELPQEAELPQKAAILKHSIEDIIPYSTINQWDHCLRKVSRIWLVANKKLFWMREVITNITNTVKAAWY